MAGYGIDWNLLQPADIGGAFQRGMDQGKARNALSTLGTNPKDGQAMNALMSVDPDTAFQFQDRQIRQGQLRAQDTKAQQDREGEMLKRRALAAKSANDPATWDAVAQQLVALGDTEAAQAIGKFTPEYRKAVMASGGVEDDDAKPTALQQNYEFFGQQLGPDKARQYLEGQADPMQWQRVEGADGSVQLIPLPRNAGAGQAAPQGGGDDPFAPLIGAESNGQQFGPDGQPLTSSAGAIGIAQVMPSTGPEAAKYAGLPWDENRFRTDPQYNEALGRAYHAVQLAQFDGNPAAAAAAYNAGPGRARSAGAPQTQGDWQKRLPAETRAYIGKVAPGFAGGIQVSPPKPPKEKDAPSGYQWRGNRLQAIPGGPGDPAIVAGKRIPKELTESQSKATGFFAQGVTALNTINSLGSYNVGEVARALDDSSPMAARGISQRDKRALNAQRAFANASLRLETGATITPAEINEKTRVLFPMPGDGAEVLADKKLQREAVLQALSVAAGPGAKQVDVTRGRPPQKKAGPKTVAGGKLVKAADGVLEWKP